MADVLLNLIEQTPASGLAVGGALVAAAVGFSAVKVFGGGASKSGAAEAASAPKKKKKSKAPKKKAVDADQVAPVAKQAEPAADINLDDFVSNDPDTEDEEAARAEKKKLKRKLKKKNANLKAKTAAAETSEPEATAEKKKAAAAAALLAAKQDADEGWATVKTKKAPKSKQN